LPAAFGPPQLGSSRRLPVCSTSLSPKLDAVQRGWNVYTLLFKLLHNCEVNIHSTSSQHHDHLPPLPPYPYPYPDNPHTLQAGPGPVAAPSPGSFQPCVAVAPATGPSRPSGAVAGLRPARRGGRHVAGPGPVAAPSQGSYRPGFAVAPVAGLLPALRRCRQAPTSGGSVSGLIPAATRLHVGTAPTANLKSLPRLHVSMAPTPAGKVTMSVWHRRPWAMSTPKYRTEPKKNWLGASTAKSRSHGSISAAAASRPDSYNSEKLRHNFMCRASSTAVDDSLWHGADVGSSLTACTFTSRFCAHRIFPAPLAPARGALLFSAPSARRMI
jgi:hypothetical protein